MESLYLKITSSFFLCRTAYLCQTAFSGRRGAKMPTQAFLPACPVPHRPSARRAAPATSRRPHQYMASEGGGAANGAEPDPISSWITRAATRGRRRGPGGSNPFTGGEWVEGVVEREKDVKRGRGRGRGRGGGGVRRDERVSREDERGVREESEKEKRDEGGVRTRRFSQARGRGGNTPLGRRRPAGRRETDDSVRLSGILRTLKMGAKEKFGEAGEPEVGEGENNVEGGVTGEEAEGAETEENVEEDGEFVEAEVEIDDEDSGSGIVKNSEDAGLSCVDDVDDEVDAGFFSRYRSQRPSGDLDFDTAVSVGLVAEGEENEKDVKDVEVEKEESVTDVPQAKENTEDTREAKESAGAKNSFTTLVDIARRGRSHSWGNGNFETSRSRSETPRPRPDKARRGAGKRAAPQDVPPVAEKKSFENLPGGSELLQQLGATGEEARGSPRDNFEDDDGAASRSRRSPRVRTGTPILDEIARNRAASDAELRQGEAGTPPKPALYFPEEEEEVLEDEPWAATGRSSKANGRFASQPRNGTIRSRAALSPPVEWLPKTEEEIFQMRSDPSILAAGFQTGVGVVLPTDCPACVGTGLRACDVCEGNSWIDPPPESTKEFDRLPFNVRAVWERPDLVVDSGGCAQCPFCNGIGKAFCKTCEGSGSTEFKGFDQEAERVKVFDLAVEDPDGDYAYPWSEYSDADEESVQVGNERDGDDYGELDDDEEDDAIDSGVRSAAMDEDWVIYEGDGDLEGLGLTAAFEEEAEEELEEELEEVEDVSLELGEDEDDEDDDEEDDDLGGLNGVELNDGLEEESLDAAEFDGGEGDYDGEDGGDAVVF